MFRFVGGFLRSFYFQPKDNKPYLIARYEIEITNFTKNIFI